jgi:hypothetical protein
MFSRNYQLTHDIDWFCLINGVSIHAASNGGLLPNKYCSTSELRGIQQVVNGLDENFEYGINRNIEIQSNPYLEDLGQDFYYYFPETIGLFDDIPLTNSQKAYYWSFVKMAKKGFFSFDRSKKSNAYNIVAWPKCFIYGENKMIPLLKVVTYTCDLITNKRLMYLFYKLRQNNLSLNLVEKLNKSSKLEK